jgi:hypothetical protein
LADSVRQGCRVADLAGDDGASLQRYFSDFDDLDRVPPASYLYGAY